MDIMELLGKDVGIFQRHERGPPSDEGEYIVDQNVKRSKRVDRHIYNGQRKCSETFPRPSERSQDYTASS
jgi:hypothetical protein